MHYITAYIVKIPCQLDFVSYNILFLRFAVTLDSLVSYAIFGYVSGSLALYICGHLIVYSFIE